MGRRDIRVSVRCERYGGVAPDGPRQRLAPKCYSRNISRRTTSRCKSRGMPERTLHCPIQRPGGDRQGGFSIERLREKLSSTNAQPKLPICRAEGKGKETSVKKGKKKRGKVHQCHDEGRITGRYLCRVSFGCEDEWGKCRAQTHPKRTSRGVERTLIAAEKKQLRVKGAPSIQSETC